MLPANGSATSRISSIWASVESGLFVVKHIIRDRVSRTRSKRESIVLESCRTPAAARMPSLRTRCHGARMRQHHASRSLGIHAAESCVPD